MLEKAYRGIVRKFLYGKNKKQRNVYIVFYSARKQYKGICTLPSLLK